MLYPILIPTRSPQKSHRPCLNPQYFSGEGEKNKRGEKRTADRTDSLTFETSGRFSTNPSKWGPGGLAMQCCVAPQGPGFSSTGLLCSI